MVNAAIKRAKSGQVVRGVEVEQMLKDAGHTPSNPTAGLARKSLTVTAVNHFVDRVLLTVETLSQADREMLAAKFFELAMKLRMQPPSVEPIVPALTDKTSSRKKTSEKSAARKPAR